MPSQLKRDCTVAFLFRDDDEAKGTQPLAYAEERSTLRAVAAAARLSRECAEEDHSALTRLAEDGRPTP